MSQIEQALVALIDSRIAAAMGSGQAGVQAAPIAPAPIAPQPVADPFGGLGAAPVQQQQTVTPDMVQSLILPLIGNEAVKARLSAEMQAMGIVNLGDATPAQLPELYTRFQRVAAEVNGAGVQQQQPAASNGII